MEWQLRQEIWLALLNVKGNCNCLSATAVSPPLRGGDLLSCLAKKVGKEGAPDGATTSSGFDEKSGRDPNSHRLK
ncbi:hypothetical protein, partial [Cupriavidus basilensis]|uniref:hypothetical protein n=1 Tax=Cupriavidus basilensis TaxID=68895 RepID=UPI002840106A